MPHVNGNGIGPGYTFGINPSTQQQQWYDNSSYNPSSQPQQLYWQNGQYMQLNPYYIAPGYQMGQADNQLSKYAEQQHPNYAQQYIPMTNAPNIYTPPATPTTPPITQTPTTNTTSVQPTLPSWITQYLNGLNTGAQNQTYTQQSMNYQPQQYQPLSGMGNWLNNLSNYQQGQYGGWSGAGNNNGWGSFGY